MSIALYLMASVVMAGLWLNRNGKQGRTLDNQRTVIPEDEKPSNKNIYHSEKYYDVFNQEFAKAGEAYLKSEDPINENVLPRFYNEMQANQETSPELKSYIEKRGSRLKYYNEQVNGRENFINEGGKEQTIDSSPMFNPLGKDVPATMLTEAEQRDQAAHYQIGNRSNGIANNSTKEEHFGNMTISGPRNSNNPNEHSNMTPYFGSHIYQNTDPEANQSLLERFTGQTGSSTELRAAPKREIPSLFDRTPGQTNIYGAPSDDISVRDRYQTSTLKTNLTPIEQVRVGQGITPGVYDSKPRDGFHSWYRPAYRNVDELRVNPKNQYEGRLNPGEELVKNRGVIGETFKNHPDRFYENDPRRWFKTTGAYLAPAIRENAFAKEQNRENTLTEYTGIAGNRENLGSRPTVYLEGTPTDTGNGTCPPFNGPVPGINGQVHHTDRNQLSSFEDFTNIQGDQKRQQKTPYDQAKTTTKETTYVENYTGQVNGEGGVQRSQKYLYDEARPTTKQGTHVMNYTGQVAGEGGVQHNQKYLYDQARPTTKEGTYVINYTGQVAGEQGVQHAQKYLYDEARPTTKQGTYVINYTGQVNGEGGVQHAQKYLYDNAKPTTKQTTYVINYAGQVNGEGGVQHAQKYLYDEAKPTTKQTTHVMNYSGQVGGENGVQHAQEYFYDEARPTTKETTHVMNYSGQVAGEGGVSRNQKYLYDNARTTTKETTHLVNYSGIIGNNENGLPTSYESMYNATNRNTQEQILQGRNYGPNKATNISVGACDVNMQIKQRANYDINKWGPIETKQYTAIPSVCENFGNTDTHNQRDQPGIRQPEQYVVTQHERNPYSQSLVSAPQLTTPFVRAEHRFTNY